MFYTSCLVCDAYLGVKLQPLESDGCEGELLSTQSYPVHNLLMLQHLHRLTVDLQQQLSILNARPLGWIAAFHLTQNVNYYLTTQGTQSQWLKFRLAVLEFASSVYPLTCAS